MDRALVRRAVRNAILNHIMNTEPHVPGVDIAQKVDGLTNAVMAKLEVLDATVFERPGNYGSIH